MKKRVLLANALLSLLCLLPVSAQQDVMTYILYSELADVNGDGVPERLLIGSTTSADPTARSPKEFVICHKQGNRYVVAFRATIDPENSFHTGLLTSQWEDPTVWPAGLYVDSRGEAFWPEIKIVFASGSDNLRVFQYNGTGYQEIYGP